MSLSAANMNSASGRWEPLIEPWQVNADWSREFKEEANEDDEKDGAKRSRDATRQGSMVEKDKVSCNAMQPFELNVSHALLVEGMRAVRILARIEATGSYIERLAEDDDYKGRAEWNEEEVMPCAVNNLTELDVRFQNSKMDALLLAKPGTVVPFEGGMDDMRKNDDFALTRHNEHLVKAIRRNDLRQVSSWTLALALTLSRMPTRHPTRTRTLKRTTPTLTPHASPLTPHPHLITQCTPNMAGELAPLAARQRGLGRLYRRVTYRYIPPLHTVTYRYIPLHTTVTYHRYIPPLYTVTRGFGRLDRRERAARRL